MQFAGFRSVIGTMQAVDDADTNKIMPKSYENMLDGCGRLDYTRAALALQRTMNSLVGQVCIAVWLPRIYSMSLRMYLLFAISIEPVTQSLVV